MTYFTCFFLDSEKDIIVNLYQDLDHLYYKLVTPNHKSGNLIRNLAKLCGLPLSCDTDRDQVRSGTSLAPGPTGFGKTDAFAEPEADGTGASAKSGSEDEFAEQHFCIRGEVPCYIDGNNEEIFIFRLGDTKVANIYPDGRVEMKASIPSIAKTLMSQTTDYRLPISKTIFKTYIPRELKFHADLHTHMNGNLSPDILIALGIRHQIRYPLYYVRKLELKLTDAQEEVLGRRREKVARQFVDSGLRGKYLARRINDNTFINFADLILRNLDNAEENIVKIRISLAILKDGQAVFTNLEKVYLYRYVFTKGTESEEKIPIEGISRIPDPDVAEALRQMLRTARHRSIMATRYSRTVFCGLRAVTCVRASAMRRSATQRLSRNTSRSGCCMRCMRLCRRFTARRACRSVSWLRSAGFRSRLSRTASRRKITWFRT